MSILHIMESIKENLEKIRERVAAACLRSGRKTNDVRLLLATKTVPPQIILEAFACKATLIGENRVQELLEKYDALKNVPHENHFIGHLQSNKIKSVIDKVNCIESVDTSELAQKLNARLTEQKTSMNIFIEVNTSGELTKNGCKPADVFTLIEQIAELPALNIRGLMTIGALTEEEKEVRKCFVLLRNIAEKINAQKTNVRIDELSMGMSSDFEWAIEEGATEIRVGSAVFGFRPKNI